jgi:DNA-binding phage protein
MDLNEFLYKLKHIIEAKGGMSTVAKRSNLSRTGLYKMFDTKHFKVDNFKNILDAVGLRLSIQPSEKYKYI